MAGADDAGLTREGFIWRAAEMIARAEGKSFTLPGSKPNISRDYLLDLIRVLGQALDGKEVPFPDDMSDQELEVVIRQEDKPD